MAIGISQTLCKGCKAEKWHAETQILKRPLKFLDRKGLEMKRNNGEMQGTCGPRPEVIIFI